MTYSLTRKDSLSGALQSKTLYYTGFGKGDEGPACSIIYNTAGATVRNVSIFYYADQRADAADLSDVMTFSLTRKDSLSGALQSKTLYYTGFGKGDEVADYSINYKTDGATVRNVSIFYYADQRADAADLSDVMTFSLTRKDSLSDRKS